MNKRIVRNIWSIGSTVALFFGVVLVFYFANGEGTDYILEAVIGLLCSFLLAPAFHEVGHVAFGFLTDMECVYIKFFCFQVKRVGGELEPSPVSPFLPDQTQVVPTKSGNMQKRASLYTLGGLIFSGGILLLIAVVATLLSCFGHSNYLLWGLVPYTAYLLLLNLAPVEYDSGKTDMLIFEGLEKGYDAEKVMLAAMEIQGLLYEGKSFSEIDESLFFDVPQLAEDEPLFAVMLDLRYRYYLEKNHLRKAADCLNRLAGAQEYLPMEELQKLAGEFVYMHALKGDILKAKESEKSCGNYLKTDESATRYRIMCAYKAAAGEEEEAKEYKKQAEKALQKERIAGLAKHENILLSRIK